MFKGVLGGFLTGTVLSGLVLVTASVLAPVPRQTSPEAAAVEVPAGSAFKQGREDGRATLPRTDSAPEAETMPRVALPEPDDLGPLEAADTAPAEPPQAGLVEPRLKPPEAQSDAGDLAATASEPVLPSPQALPPEAPSAESGPAVSTGTAPLVAPPPERETAQTTTATATARIAEPSVPSPQAVGAIDTESAPAPRDETAISVEPAQPPLPEIEEESGLRKPVVGTTSATEQAGRAALSGEAGQSPRTQPARGQPARRQPGETRTEEARSAGAQAREEEESAEGPTETHSGVIDDLAPGVTTGRLPTIAARADDSAPPPPLERFAAPFENPEGKPPMAIILIDDGQSPITHKALADFPYPLNFAVDADWPGATAAAARYRAAGFEVLAMVDLPEGATAADVEVAMQSHLAAVPEAVAVMEGTRTGLQVSREAIRQLIPILKESGHGLVLFSRGLDTAEKLIAREGVPVATVFRDFDGKGQNATVIRRFLDQAAFKANQERRGVIMVGRLRAETVSALLLWGLQDRASSVALAPVSAILREAGRR